MQQVTGIFLWAFLLYCLNMLLSSHEEGSYLLDAEVDPVAKASVTTRREDDRVETVAELGIFQLLDRLEEVTRELTSRLKIEL
jgi:hypothetical protein